MKAGTAGHRNNKEGFKPYPYPFSLGNSIHYAAQVNLKLKWSSCLSIQRAEDSMLSLQSSLEILT